MYHEHTNPTWLRLVHHIYLSNEPTPNTGSELNQFSPAQWTRSALERKDQQNIAVIRIPRQVHMHASNLGDFWDATVLAIAERKTQ